MQGPGARCYQVIDGVRPCHVLDRSCPAVVSANGRLTAGLADRFIDRCQGLVNGLFIVVLTAVDRPVMGIIWKRRARQISSPILRSTSADIFAVSRRPGGRG